MSNKLSQLILPIKNENTGQISNETFDIGGNSLSLSDSITSTSSINDGVAATPKAIKTVNDKFGTEFTQSLTTSTSTTTSVTFTNSIITTNSTIYVETTNPKLTYDNITTNNGSCTVTFPKQTTASTVTVKLIVKN